MNLDLLRIEEYQKSKSILVEEQDYVHNPRILLTVAIEQLNSHIRGAGLLYDLSENCVLEYYMGEKMIAQFPYIPTFLALRNKIPLLEVIKHFKNFDVLIVKGAGLQHPRLFGLSCELGVNLDVPTIGVTKNSLFGTIKKMKSLVMIFNDFEIYPVYWKDKIIANFIKKNSNKKGIYVSVGHKISLRSATNIILPLLQYRIPEPIRLLKIYFKAHS